MLLGKVAHLGGDAPDAGRNWRKHRGLARHKNMAPQDASQEVQIWRAGYNRAPGCGYSCNRYERGRLALI